MVIETRLVISEKTEDIHTYIYWAKQILLLIKSLNDNKNKRKKKGGFRLEQL